MKKVVKRIVQVSYLCEKCQTSYSDAEDARKCERAGVEKRPFKVGDRVWVGAAPIRIHSCGCAYFCAGRIVKITGPLPYDTLRRVSLGVPRKGHGHYYLYEIDAGPCPICHRPRSVECPSHILKRAPKR